ncbi:MAG: acetyl-CoA carboxylase biotin carboxylase subunit [Alphaproteobacteria bacterium]|nr:MAG: acetyl-CoA carboxylase biotin carboxylase subunit [Alphaproteobacteria bacterium]
MFHKILIANRGEIALRIIRACKEMGVRTIIAHSTIDAESKPVRLADESICIGPAPSRDSYLNMQSIISAAVISGAQAIHPGVGFLSENDTFASMVEEHDLIFIGPSPTHIKVMGDKVTAKQTLEKFGVPVVPGSAGAVRDDQAALQYARSIGFPILIKASSGGGGKGMQIVYSEKDIPHALRIARSEAKSNFGDDTVFMEKYLTKPRHIEVQVLADNYGNVVHLGERDCSIQRRHQKIWEEAPGFSLTEKERYKLGKVVTRAVQKLGYRGVGTFEFLYEEGQFYFIEMNTRIQVEHPITEMITGIDLIREQIRVAAGEKLRFKQSDIRFSGHAIECRINAEDPETFMPSPGLVEKYHPPGGMHVRVDSHLYAGYKVPPTYDSLVGKIIVYGETRAECLARLQRALEEFVITGIKTNIPLHKRLAHNSNIAEGAFDIHWLERYLAKPE